jgi:hypothetical protein
LKPDLRSASGASAQPASGDPSALATPTMAMRRSERACNFDIEHLLALNHAGTGMKTNRY